MSDKFLDMTMTDSVRAAQRHYYGGTLQQRFAPANETLGEEEMAFIQSRDSFYLGSISESGWPYIQHRGGRRGFVKALSPTELVFADFKGNRQLLSTGNIAANDRVCLFLMDYPLRTRLKILGRARVVDARERPELVTELADGDTRRVVERFFFVEVASFSWNCQQHITPRFTAEEIAGAVAPLKQRIAELEKQLKDKS